MNTRPIRQALLITTSVICATCLIGSPGRAGRRGPSLSGRIVYSNNSVDTNWYDQIYSMNADGSSRTRLTFSKAYEAYPSWSPTGKRVAFESETDDPVNGTIVVLFVMNSDGSGLQKLTSGPYDRTPSWSPDGRWIVFGRGQSSISALDMLSPGNGPVPVYTAGSTNAWYPRLAPDGKRIVFVQGYDICTVNLDGSGFRDISDSPNVYEDSPIWSLDGRSILYFQRATTLSGQVLGDYYLMDASGGNRRRITFSGQAVPLGGPTWSPDGLMFAYTRLTSGSWQLFAAIAATGREMQLTNDPGNSYFPSWTK